MAILHKSVLGTFTNKVGGVVGSSWKGIPVVRSLPASVANPRSSAQMTQRMRFALMINFATLILTGWIRPLWNRNAKRMSGFNAFVRANMSAFNLDGNIVLSEVIASSGRLLAPAFDRLQQVSPGLQIELINPTNDRYASPNDEIYLIVLDKTDNSLVFAGGTGVVRGNLGVSEIELPTFTGEEVAVWAAYRNPRGIFVSNSAFMSIGSLPDVVQPTSAMLFEFAKIMKIDTSNIDTSISEAAAVAVLKEAIREKTAVKEVVIESKGEVLVADRPEVKGYKPVPEEIIVEKESLEVVEEVDGMTKQKPMTRAMGQHKRNS